MNLNEHQLVEMLGACFLIVLTFPFMALMVVGIWNSRGKKENEHSSPASKPKHI